jgi:hypothetical protein
MFGKISESIHSIQNVPDQILKEAKDYNAQRNDSMIVMCHYEWDEEESKESEKESVKIDTDNDLVNKFRKPSVESESSWDRKDRKDRREDSDTSNRRFKEDYHSKSERLFGERLMGSAKFKDEIGYGAKQEISGEGSSYVQNNILLRYPSLPVPSEYQSTPAHYTASAPTQTSEFNSPCITAKPIIPESLPSSVPTAPVASTSISLSTTSIEPPIFPISSLIPPSSSTPQSLLAAPCASFPQESMNLNTLQELQSKLLTPQIPKPTSSSYDPFEGLGNVPSASTLPPLHTEPPKPVSKKHNPFLHNL